LRPDGTTILIMVLYLLGYSAIAAVTYFVLAVRAPHMQEAADFQTGPAPKTGHLIELFPANADRRAA